MIRLADPDPATRATCLAGLNQSFPGWGGDAQFDWCYRRTSDPLPADILLSEKGGEALAALAVVYRRIGRDDEPRELVAVLSGAWTRPEARGQGEFGALIDRARDTARARGATMALAFVTGDRPSVNQLAARSERVIEAGLFACPKPAAGSVVEALEVVPPVIAAAAFAPRTDRAGRIAIVHDAHSWRDQLLDRMTDCRVVRLADRTLAALERRDDGWMLLDALPATSPDLIALGPTSIYSSDPVAMAELVAARWAQQRARIFQMPLTASRYRTGDWQVSGGERM